MQEQFTIFCNIVFVCEYIFFVFFDIFTLYYFIANRVGQHVTGAF